MDALVVALWSALAFGCFAAVILVAAHVAVLLEDARFHVSTRSGDWFWSVSVEWSEGGWGAPVRVRRELGLSVVKSTWSWPRRLPHHCNCGCRGFACAILCYRVSILLF